MPSDTAPATREGPLSHIWTWATFAALFGSLPFALADVAAALAPFINGRSYSGPVTSWAWGLYLVAQLANKVPVAYRYTQRGLLAVADLVGYGVGIVGVGCVAMALPVPSIALRFALTVGMLAWLLLGAVVQFRPSAEGLSLFHRAYCAIAAFLLPSLPMALSWALVPERSG